MDYFLKGKVALVTGAGSQIGFGKAMAVTLAGEGCDIAVTYRKNSAGIQQTVDEIKSLGRDALAVKVDICNRTEVKEMADSILSHFGKLDILVNNAGGPQMPPTPFIETDGDYWNTEIDLNLKGTLNCTKAFLGHMLSRKSGKIINISSNCALYGGDNTSVYSASKGGIVVFTRALAKEVASQGINVNCVAPGFGMTELGYGVSNEIIEDFKRTIPSRRIISAESVSHAVAYLASDISLDVVGQVLTVDGGYTMY